MKNRLLILAPRGRDAEVAARLFGQNDIAVLVCRDIAALLEAIGIGAGAVMLTEEVLSALDADRLGEWIAEQPAWSDLPFIVLANGHRAPRSERALQRLQTLGNTVLLERPLHAEAMLGAVRSALKARLRQYQIRDFAVAMEAAVQDRTAQLALARDSLEFALDAADMRERMAGVGIDPWPGSPEQLGELVRSETQRYAAIVKSAGLSKE